MLKHAHLFNRDADSLFKELGLNGLHRLIGPSDFQIQAWRNGLGQTTELLSYRQPTDPRFLWRLSMAPVLQDGSFSDFSGYDRTLVLLQGRGLLLRHHGRGEQRLGQPLEMGHFSGDWQTEGILLDGPIQDFNVMTRRDLCHADVSILEGQGRLNGEALATDLFYAVAVGEFRDNSGIHNLPAGWLLYRQPSPEAFDFSGGPLIHVRIFSKEQLLK